MKLKNKKTGEIIETCEIFENLYDKIRIRKNGIESYDYEYNSLAELAEEWEDMPEEPKEYWFINSVGGIIRPTDTNDWTPEDASHHKEIGNYFETREEAEKAVKKLKAWKRLKDKGFRFQGWEDLEAIELPIKHYSNIVGFRLEDNHDVIVDLNTIFGGEE